MEVSKKGKVKFYVDSSAFYTLAPDKQTEEIAKADGLPVQFVNGFGLMRRTDQLIQRLTTGKEMHIAEAQLDFLNIELSSDVVQALATVKSFVDSIKGAVVATYQWRATEPSDGPFIVGSLNISRSGYRSSISNAAKMWKKVSKIWHQFDQGQRTGEHNAGWTSFGNATRALDVYPDRFEFGCQTFERKDVEALALRMGWEPAID